MAEAPAGYQFRIVALRTGGGEDAVKVDFAVPKGRALTYGKRFLLESATDKGHYVSEKHDGHIHVSTTLDKQAVFTLKKEDVRALRAAEGMDAEGKPAALYENQRM